FSHVPYIRLLRIHSEPRNTSLGRVGAVEIQTESGGRNLHHGDSHTHELWVSRGCLRPHDGGLCEPSWWQVDCELFGCAALIHRNNDFARCDEAGHGAVSVYVEVAPMPGPVTLNLELVIRGLQHGRSSIRERVTGRW